MLRARDGNDFSLECAWLRRVNNRLPDNYGTYPHAGTWAAFVRYLPIRISGAD
jgi:hypothetical protein